MTATTTKKPRASRNKTTALADLPAFVDEMRKRGVAAFKLGDFEVNFAPTAHGDYDGSDADNLDPFVAAEKVKQAVENFNKANKEETELLEWSV